MKVAFAVWNGRISPVLDVSRQLIILDIEDKMIIRRNEKRLASTDIVSRVNRLAGMNIQALICGAASQPILGMLQAFGIQVTPFVAGDVEEVIQAYLRGALPNPAMVMPGCGRGRRKGFRRRKRGR